MFQTNAGVAFHFQITDNKPAILYQRIRGVFEVDFDPGRIPS